MTAHDFPAGRPEDAPNTFAAGIAEIGLRARMARDPRQMLGVIADQLGC